MKHSTSPTPYQLELEIMSNVREMCRYSDNFCRSVRTFSEARSKGGVVRRMKFWAIPVAGRTHQAYLLSDHAGLVCNRLNEGLKMAGYRLSYRIVSSRNWYGRTDVAFYLHKLCS